MKVKIKKRNKVITKRMFFPFVFNIKLFSPEFIYINPLFLNPAAAIPIAVEAIDKL